MRDTGGTLHEPAGAASWAPRLGAVLLAVAVASAVSLCTRPALAQVTATYLHTLANFGGALPYSFGRVSIDEERGEAYVIYQNLVRVFTASGMETFSFGDDLDLGHILDAAVDERGDILLLSYKDQHTLVTRCDFRGVPIGPFEITGLPDGMTFGATRLIRRGGLLYFAAVGAGQVFVTDQGGVFKEHIDLLAMLELDEKQKENGVEIIGFWVAADRSIYFTVPVMFKAFRRSPDGQLASFGRAGSATGQFGVVAGIVADSRGNVLVADKLKCVVMAYDRDFKFLGQFGYRGAKPQNLIVPAEIAIDKGDRLFVTQARQRGVSVFAITGG